MEPSEVKATSIKTFLEMDAKTFMAEWKRLSDDDKLWYKTEMAKLLTAEGK